MMKKIIIFLFIITVTNVQAKSSIEEKMNGYIDEISIKNKNIERINTNLIQAKDAEGSKKLICERRIAVRSYISTLNKIINSEELNMKSEIEDANEIKESLIQNKNEYLIALAEEDQKLQQSMVGEGNNTEGFEMMTLDQLCQD
ncbi:hypothetical protein [Acinetobacter towneri]|uniref:hypothetical protein n=1 Tax=Acinetobacter towneri TaxID=202956 RepID=UPI002097C877|nr:hypothetical protein [Acinetobacter towneri]MCO8055167.1 hypothetical protein [Acinetobacter towneri]